MKLVIEIDEERYDKIKRCTDNLLAGELERAVKNGTPLTPDILADLLMEERIIGELKQDISYSKDIIDDVKCTLTVSIIDNRPCYCGAELKEVWRDDISERQPVEQEKWTNFAEELKDVFEDEEEE